MSQQKKQVKKTVVVTSKQQQQKKEKLKATTSRSRASARSTSKSPLIFTRVNYKFMLIGVLLIALGMVLMLGGAMPTPDVWDDSLIYSFRRTVIAPVFILAGLLVEVYAIFKNS